MSVSAVSEEVERFEAPFGEEKSRKDVMAEKISDLANGILKPFWFAEKAIHPFLPWHKGRYGQCQLRIMELGRRILNGMFLTPTLLASLPFTGVSGLMHFGAMIVHTRPYRITEGTFQGKITQPTIGILPAQMFPGTLSITNYGLSEGGDRLERLLYVIHKNDPDILFLPGLHTSFASRLTREFKEKYQWIFSHMGTRPLGFDPSFFVAFRGKLEKEPKYISLTCQQGLTERGYFKMETLDTIYLCTSLLTLDDLKEIFLRDYGTKKIVLMGDLEIERHSPEWKFLVKLGFDSPLQEGITTQTNAPFIDFNKSDEENVKEQETEMIFIKGEKRSAQASIMWKDTEPFNAISDHKFILC